jgi:hypothetical protein
VGQTVGVSKSNWLEGSIAILIPPACREEVLGDLHERNTSQARFAMDAIRTVPLVIASRIRRAAEARLLLMHALVLYLSYYTAAWLSDQVTLQERWGLLRLAIPGAVTLLGLILEDAYAKPGRRSALRLARGPLLGLAWALLLEASLARAHSTLTLPFWVALCGGALGLLLTSALRLLFSPPSTSPQGRI